MPCCLSAGLDIHARVGQLAHAMRDVWLLFMTGAAVERSCRAQHLCKWPSWLPVCAGGQLGSRPAIRQTPHKSRGPLEIVFCRPEGGGLHILQALQRQHLLCLLAPESCSECERCSRGSPLYLSLFYLRMQHVKQKGAPSVQLLCLV